MENLVIIEIEIPPTPLEQALTNLTHAELLHQEAVKRLNDAEAVYDITLAALQACQNTFGKVVKMAKQHVKDGLNDGRGN